MPAKTTSRIAWKSEKQKKAAVRKAKRRKKSLSAQIQEMFDQLDDD